MDNDKQPMSYGSEESTPTDHYGPTPSQIYSPLHHTNSECIYDVFEEDDRTHIEIEELTSEVRGGGTEEFRKVLSTYFQNEYTGDIVLHAATRETTVSPVMFYLYMGMVPDYYYPSNSSRKKYFNEQIPYLSTFNITATQTALQALQDFEDEQEFSQFVDKLSADAKLSLKLILSVEMQRIGHQTPDFNTMSDAELVENKWLLLELSVRTISVLEVMFIPLLLTRMKANLKTDEKIELMGNHGSIVMKMSPEGFTRWRKAIDEGLKFEPFKDLSHLPMNFLQRHEIDQIIHAKTDHIETTDPLYTQYLQKERSTRFKTENKYQPSAEETFAVQRVLSFSDQPYGHSIPQIQKHPEMKSMRIIDDYQSDENNNYGSPRAHTK